jgi:hypothetical protein
MAKYFKVIMDDGTIDITYIATGSVNVHFIPERQPLKGYEMICAHGDGTVYDEEGPGDRARRLRLYLPKLQDVQLPTEVKKSLSSIR